MTLQSLARTIAKARHGTDAMWANYMGAAEAARLEIVAECIRVTLQYDDNLGSEVSALTIANDIADIIAQPDGAAINKA